MISYEVFEKSINAIKEYTEYEEKLMNLGVGIWERDEVSNLITSYVDFISAAFNLEKFSAFGTELDYWIYELDFGTDPRGLMDNHPDREVFCTTLENLYNYLLHVND